jgi:hypothetical protein
MSSCVDKKQAGLSLTGLIFLLVILGFVGVTALKIVPIYSEYRAICKAVENAKQGATTVAEAQKSFDLQSSAGYIGSISGKDLDITRSGNGVEISFAYQRKIHLVGPASLLFEFSGSTENGKL